MKLTIYNMEGKNAGEAQLADGVLIPNRRGTQALVEAITAYRANQRAGTASTLTKGTVNGSGKKPWRQKGTGQARAGYKQSPLWRGGGVVFGPHPRDYSKRVNKSVARLALQRAFTDRVKAGDVVVVEQFSIPEPKTRLVAAALKKLNADRGALVVLDAVSPDVARASRNLPKVEVTAASQVNTYQLMRYHKVILNKPALDVLSRRIAAERE